MCDNATSIQIYLNDADTVNYSDNYSLSCSLSDLLDNIRRRAVIRDMRIQTWPEEFVPSKTIEAINFLAENSIDTEK